MLWLTEQLITGFTRWLHDDDTPFGADVIVKKPLNWNKLIDVIVTTTVFMGLFGG